MEKEKAEIISFIVGFLLGCLLIRVVWKLYSNDEYKNIEDIKGDKILIICEDKSTEWFDLPKCEGSSYVQD